jgi:hypothetical protein
MGGLKGKPTVCCYAVFGSRTRGKIFMKLKPDAYTYMIDDRFK